VVSIVCVGGLAYALVTDWNTEPERRMARGERGSSGGGGSGGFGLGVAVGIGAGVVLGSLVALRKRRP
jgi:hypothetical protein